MELESVTEGDSVTLRSGVTDVQTDDEIEWMFSESNIAKISSDSGEISVWVKSDGSFRNRLQLDKQTGDLKISNIRTKDSGLYKVKISSPRGSPELTFNVYVVSAGGVKPVTVNEGDSVTLRTGLTEIQTDDVIRWRFGQQDSTVAGKTITSNGPDERFRGRLRQDSQTGSLLITNINSTDSGVYEVDITTTSRYTIHKSFSVTVSGEMKSVSVKEGETVTLQITEIQSDDLIVWMFGNINLAEFNKIEPRFYIYDGPDERFRGRLKLDHQTGSLYITNINTTYSGDYQLKISGSRSTINRRITVTVTGADLDSDSGLSRGAVAGIVVVVVLLVAAVIVAGVIYHRHKISEPERQREENGGNHMKQKTDVPANEETELCSEEPRVTIHT